MKTVDRIPYDNLAEIETWLRKALGRALPGVGAQQSLAPVPRPQTPWPEVAGMREAAALLLVYPGPAGPTVVLTVRASRLAHHGGQVSLPGGGVDEGESIEAAALREAAEEIGVAPVTVRVVGRLTPLHIPVSGNTLNPVVGVTGERPSFRLDEREVDRVLEVPLAVLLDPTRVKRTSRSRDGVSYDVPYLEIDGHQLWGATAMVMAEFLTLFGWHPAESAPGK